MTVFATDISTWADRLRFGALILGALALDAPAFAQDEQKGLRDREPDVEDVVMTPVDDLNLDRDELPEVLVTAARNPYADLASQDCDAIGAAISELDSVLGPDYDLVADEEDRLSEGKIAKRVVSSFIPFRGFVREVSGAASEKRKLEAAVMAGMTRRGYLKGLGNASGCPYPARPAFVAIKIDDSDLVEMDPDEEPGKD